MHIAEGAKNRDHTMRESTRMDPRGPTQHNPRPLPPHLQLDGACLQRHPSHPAVRGEEVVVTGPGAAHQTSRVQLLPDRHPRRATRSQQMTSFSPSQLKSELRWFPSTTRPLSLTGQDCCQPALTASTPHTNHSSVGRQANAAVVCSRGFKIRYEPSEDESNSGQGQPFHDG